MAISNSFFRKCKLSVVGSNFTGTHTDVTIVLNEDNLPLAMFDADGTEFANNGGGDIRFATDALGLNQISCEVVSFVTDPNPALGTAEIWIKVPTLTPTTEIYIFWNLVGEVQPLPTSLYGSQNVHSLSELATNHNITDSTGSHVLSQINGQSGDEFDGVDDQITFDPDATGAFGPRYGTPLPLTKPYSISCVLRPDSYGASLGQIFAPRANGVTDARELSIFLQTKGGVPTITTQTLYGNGGSQVVSGSVVYGNTIHVYAEIGADDQTRLFIDGVEQTGAYFDYWRTSSGLGNSFEGDPKGAYGGLIKFVRARNGTFSNTRITLEFSNQRATSGFITAGTVELAGGAVVGGETTLTLDSGDLIVTSDSTEITVFTAALSGTYYEIKVSAANINTDLSDYPLLIHMHNLPASFWASVRDDGGNIRAFNEGSLSIPIDVSHIDTRLQVGRIRCKTNISSTTDTIVYIQVLSAGTASVADNSIIGRDSVYTAFHAFIDGDKLVNRTGGIALSHTGSANSLYKFTTSASPVINAGNHQGTGFDGAYYYTYDNNQLNKYDLGGTLVLANSDPIGDTGVTGVNHFGDGTIIGDEIFWVLEQYPSAVYDNQYLVVFNKNTLVYLRHYDISAQLREISSVAYDPVGNRLLISDYEVGGSIPTYSLTGVYLGDITLTKTLASINGIEIIDQTLYVAGVELNSVDMDGTVRGRVMESSEHGGGQGGSQGITHDGEGGLLVHKAEILGTYKYTPVSTPYYLSRQSIRNDIGVLGLPSDTSASMGAEIWVELLGSHQAVLTTVDSANSGSRSHLQLQSGGNFNGWDSSNGWSNPSPSVPYVAYNYYHVGSMYNDAVDRRLFVDGVKISTDTGIIAKPSSGSLMDFVVGSSGYGANAEIFYGALQGMWMHKEAVSDAWFKAVNDNSDGGFYAVTEVTASGTTFDLDNTLHLHAADTVGISVLATINMDSVFHAHATDATFIVSTSSFTLADAFSEHAVTSVDISGEASLLLEGSFHEQVVDQAILSSTNFMAVTDTDHTHLSDNVTISADQFLIVAGVAHDHVVDQASLSAASFMAINNTDHPHFVGALIISADQFLTVSGADHIHTVDQAAISASNFMAISDTYHTNETQSANIDQLHIFSVDSPYHAHDVNQASMGAIVSVDVQGAFMSHVAGSSDITGASNIPVSVNNFSIHSATEVSVSQTFYIGIEDSFQMPSSTKVEINQLAFIDLDATYLLHIATSPIVEDIGFHEHFDLFAIPRIIPLIYIIE